MQFKAYSDLVEVNGETVYSVIDGMGVFKNKAVHILEKNGIVDPKPDMWFKQQNWLDAFYEISKSLGNRTLYSIGFSIPLNARFPSEIDSIEKALASIDVAYHMNHRNGEIGHYKFEKTGERNGKMVCENPYPCIFDHGIIEAVTQMIFISKKAVVKHDNTCPCRKHGAESCTYLISW